MKKKVTTSKKNSPVWLIIFLCIIIVGLVWMVNYSKRLGETNLLNQEIQRLNEEFDRLEASRETEIKRLKETISSFSSPSAVPSATTSVKLRSRIATISGEEK